MTMAMPINLTKNHSAVIDYMPWRKKDRVELCLLCQVDWQQRSIKLGCSRRRTSDPPLLYPNIEFSARQISVTFNVPNLFLYIRDIDLFNVSVSRTWTSTWRIIVTYPCPQTVWAKPPQIPSHFNPWHSCFKIALQDLWRNLLSL